MRKFTRFLALVLALVLCVGVLCISVSAIPVYRKGSTDPYTVDYDGWNEIYVPVAPDYYYVNNGGAASAARTPKTADSSMTAVWAALGCLALAGTAAGAVTVLKRREDQF